MADASGVIRPTFALNLVLGAGGLSCAAWRSKDPPLEGLVLSGVLSSQHDETLAHFSAHFDHLGTTRQTDAQKVGQNDGADAWVAIALRLRG